MLGSSPEPTDEDMREFFRTRHGPYVAEREIAVLHGWSIREYEERYRQFVFASVGTAGLVGTNSNSKGRTLEELARYLIERSGLAQGSVRDFSIKKKFQVDGHGSFNSANLGLVFGKAECGAHPTSTDFYFEGKNHSTVMTSPDFRAHRDRMRDAHVGCGICVSTAGYALSGGQGFCDVLYHDYIRQEREKIVHLLVNFEALRDVAIERFPPIVIFRNAVEQIRSRYFEGTETQRRYGRVQSLQLLNAEYVRLST